MPRAILIMIGFVMIPLLISAGIFIEALRIRSGEGQDQYGSDIVQGNRTHDHQGSHAGVSVDVLYKGDTQDSGTAAVACLDKLSQAGSVLIKNACHDPGDDDAEQGHEEAEQHVTGIPYTVKICSGHVLEQKYGKSDLIIE